MKVKAGTQYLGRVDNSNSTSRFKDLWCREEKMEWERENTKKQKKQPRERSRKPSNKTATGRTLGSRVYVFFFFIFEFNCCTIFFVEFFFLNVSGGTPWRPLLLFF